MFFFVFLNVYFCRGHPHSYYQKALLSNGVTSALRLHQRVPNFQFSREYLGRLFLEDSAHYLFYSLIFVTGPPVSSILAYLFGVKCSHNRINFPQQRLGDARFRMSSFKSNPLGFGVFNY